MRTFSLLSAILIFSNSLIASEKFDFSRLELIAKERAESEYSPPTPLPPVLANLNYDQYRAIKTGPDAVLWEGQDKEFRVELLHAGYLFKKPVKINFINQKTGVASAWPFLRKWFNYDGLVVHEEFLDSLRDFRQH